MLFRKSVELSMIAPFGRGIVRLLIVGVGSLIASLLITPWLIEPLMAGLNIGANVRGFGHTIGSARWIGLLAWGWLGWRLWQRFRERPMSYLLRWLIGGTGLTTLGILLLIATDRDLWSPEDPTTHQRWKGLPDAYSIPLIEQLWYVIDRAARLVGLRTMFGSLYWQWNYGSAALHLLEWLWLMGATTAGATSSVCPPSGLSSRFCGTARMGTSISHSQGCTMSAHASMTPAPHGGCRETPLM
jgi:hypothetical protein